MDHLDTVIGADLFSASAQRIVDYLTAHSPLREWSVSRVAGGEQVHLHVHPDTFLSVGQRVRWDDSFCIRMSRGAARVVPDAQLDPDYADHPEAQVIRAYAGVPILDDDGRLFGTLCGVGDAPLADADELDGELVTLLGDLLSSQLAMSRAVDRERRAHEIAAALAHEDALTGLVNRRGWDLLVEDAQQRVDAYGDLVAVTVIDLDGLKEVNDRDGHQAGDALIRLAARTLQDVARTSDRVARYGGDEFAVLCNDVSVDDLPKLVDRFTTALSHRGISASAGFAPTGPSRTSVTEAFAAADRGMYADKTGRAAS